MDKRTKGFVVVLLGFAIAYIGNSEIFSFLFHKILDIFQIEYTISTSKFDLLIRLGFLIFGVMISLVGVFIFKKSQKTQTGPK